MFRRALPAARNFGSQLRTTRTFSLSGALLAETKSSKTNRFASKYKKSSSGNKNGPRHDNAPKKFRQGDTRTKTIRFNFDSGSEKAKEALKDLIKRVHGYSPNYQVQFVDPQTNKLRKMHLVELVNSTDLDKDGLLMVGPLSAQEMPLVRTIRVQDMIKEYSDRLALAKEKELLALGSVIAQRVINKRMQAEKKKSATKMLALSWSISVSDLMHQKKNEILKRVDNNEKFIIFVGEKESLYSARNSVEKEDGIASQLGTSRTKWDRMDEDELAMEMKKREMIFGKLEELLAECECKYDVSGSLDARMMLNVTPKPNVSKASEKETEVSARELKRQRMLAKSREAAKAKKKIDEEDLDSLYLIKIIE